MISLHVVIMVLAVMLGFANVLKDSTVKIAQVNFQICNWWFDDQNLPTKLSLNLANLCQQRNDYNIFAV